MVSRLRHSHNGKFAERELVETSCVPIDSSTCNVPSGLDCCLQQIVCPTILQCDEHVRARTHKLNRNCPAHSTTKRQILSLADHNDGCTQCNRGELYRARGWGGSRQFLRCYIWAHSDLSISMLRQITNCELQVQGDLQMSMWQICGAWPGMV